MNTFNMQATNDNHISMTVTADIFAVSGSGCGSVCGWSGSIINLSHKEFGV